MRELVRGIRVSLRNILRELLLTLIVLVISGLLPFLAIFGGPVIFAIQAYYAGFGNMDFTLERHLGVRGSVRFVRNHKGLAIGNGAVFVLLLMIPVVGLFLAPGLSTVASTIRTIEHLEPL
jgi:CysZ protein